MRLHFISQRTHPAELLRWSIRALLLLLVFLVVGCHKPPKPHAVVGPTTSSEIDVVVAFLSEHYGSRIKTHAPLVIEDTFSVAMLRMSESHEKFTQSLLSQASDNVPADLIRDFCAKNAKPQPVWPELAKRLTVVLLSHKESDAIFSTGHDQKGDGWDKFYTRYPKSPGIITISRVGFNRQGTMAMVYVGSQSHWLAGSGKIHILRKQNGKWEEVVTWFGPQWVS